MTTKMLSEILAYFGITANNSMDDGKSVRTMTLFDSSRRADHPSDQEHTVYPINTITTSRYTLITFLPKSLMEQFRRLANVYFLVIGIIASIGYLTNVYETAVEPVGILAPMMIVISISMIKEGMEDVKRHNTDKKINMRPARRVDADGRVVPCCWQDLSVGTVVLLLRDDDIPADMVVLACGGQQGAQCYVETAALDGETNLKIRQPCLQEDKLSEDRRKSQTYSSSNPNSHQTASVQFPALALSSDCRQVAGLADLADRVVIQAEPPNEYVYKFNGSMDYRGSSGNSGNTIGKKGGNSGSSGSSGSSSSSGFQGSYNPMNSSHGTGATSGTSGPSSSTSSSPTNGTTVALSEKNLLLRGSTLRATEWVVGMVVYSGRDTKLALNSKTPPSKLSSVDRIVNKTLVIAISVMICVCILSMIFEIAWQGSNSNADYLCLKRSDMTTFRGMQSGGCENSSTSSILTIFTFATLYNNFVCISMYVSLEMVYICQAYFLSQDLALYDPVTDSPAECHSSGMCADLGQIRYVLSDKTGTLTKNIMNVRRVSLLGKVFGAPVKSPSTPLPTNMALVMVNNPNPNHNPNPNPNPNHSQDKESSRGPQGDQKGGDDGSGGSGYRISKNRDTLGLLVPASNINNNTNNNNNDNTNNNNTSSNPSSPNATSSSWNELHLMHPSNHDMFSSGEDKQHMKDFLRVLAACNTVMLMPDQGGSTGGTSGGSGPTNGPYEDTSKKSRPGYEPSEDTSKKGRPGYDPNEDTSSPSMKSPSSATAVVNNLSDLVKSLQAESSDEVALVLAAVQHSGVMLTGRGNTIAQVRGLDTRYHQHRDNLHETDLEEIEILAINEFESNRKRMSVLTRIGNDRYVLLCKGADTSMMTQCGTTWHTVPCLEHIEMFANNGLRTLIAAKRDLSQKEAMDWLAEYNAAKTSVVSRHEKLSLCAMKIEKDMDLLGAIGIEDELQDGAPEAIQMMQSGGINVWMITGDKAETAIAIGKMCALIKEGFHAVEKVIGLSDDALRVRLDELIQMVDRRLGGGTSLLTPLTNNNNNNNNNNSDNININNNNLSFSLDSVFNRLSSSFMPSSSSSSKSPLTPQKDLALVIDGTSLEGIFRNNDLRVKLSRLLPIIPTVIACRVSPLQKAALVRMVKNSSEKPVTLSIGDGANDVGMIHEARVGVGISGREGRHAANSADFAISQFRFLVPLLFEHGRFNYIRCSKLVLYSFFKNLLLVSTLFYYCLYSGFSGTVPVASLVFSGYNFYLGLPIIALGALDFDVPRNFVYHFAELAYRSGRNGELLNTTNMLRWCIAAFIQGLLIFALCVRFFSGKSYVSNEFSNNENSSNSDYWNIDGIGENSSIDGRNGGLYVDGFLLYSTTVLCMQYKVMSMTFTRTSVNWFVWIISFLGYLLFTFVYGLTPENSWYGITSLALKLPQVWIALAIVPLLVTLADIMMDSVCCMIKPSSMDSLRMLFQEMKQEQNNNININNINNNSSNDNSNNSNNNNNKFSFYNNNILLNKSNNSNNNINNINSNTDNNSDDNNSDNNSRNDNVMSISMSPLNTNHNNHNNI